MCISGSRWRWILLLLAIGCRAEAEPTSQPVAEPVTTTAPAQVVSLGEHAGLHNVFNLGKGLFSGSAPEGDAGMQSLRKLGIHTIISVDGGTPDVARAEAAGFRYVHLPVGYDGIPEQKRLEIARAVRDLPGPAYIHCHHGKHRGPAAAVSAAILLGVMTPEEGGAFLKQAGTAAIYTGLFASVHECKPVGREALDAAPADFPEVAPVAGLVGKMVEIDAALEHLLLIRAAGWRVPKDHPDLVPQDESRRLAALLEATDGETNGQSDPQVFRKLLAASTERAKGFDALVRRPQSGLGPLNAAIEALSTSCKDCHAHFRDPPKPAASRPH